MQEVEKSFPLKINQLLGNFVLLNTCFQIHSLNILYIYFFLVRLKTMALIGFLQGG